VCKTVLSTSIFDFVLQKMANNGPVASKNGVVMHELTSNELVVESQYLLKLQSGKIAKKNHSYALVSCHGVSH